VKGKGKRVNFSHFFFLRTRMEKYIKKEKKKGVLLNFVWRSDEACAELLFCSWE